VRTGAAVLADGEVGVLLRRTRKKMPRPRRPRPAAWDCQFVVVRWVAGRIRTETTDNTANDGSDGRRG
jgi:hypothetical protein